MDDGEGDVFRKSDEGCRCKQCVQNDGCAGLACQLLDTSSPRCNGHAARRTRSDAVLAKRLSRSIIDGLNGFGGSSGILFVLLPPVVLFDLQLIRAYLWLRLPGHQKRN